jgi:hypothetical protein
LVNYLKGIGPAPVRGDCVREALTPPSPTLEPIKAPALKLNDKIEADGME